MEALRNKLNTTYTLPNLRKRFLRQNDLDENDKDFLEKSNKEQVIEFILQKIEKDKEILKSDAKKNLFPT